MFSNPAKVDSIAYSPFKKAYAELIFALLLRDLTFISADLYTGEIKLPILERISRPLIYICRAPKEESFPKRVASYYSRPVVFVEGKVEPCATTSYNESSYSFVKRDSSFIFSGIGS